MEGNRETLEKALRDKETALTAAIREKKKTEQLAAQYAAWLNDLWPLGEPPYFVGIFHSFSSAKDPRQDLIRAKKIPVDYKKCLIMLSNGDEVLGSVNKKLSQNLKPGQLVFLNGSYNVVTIVPEDEIEALRMLREGTVHEVIGDLILVTDKDGRGVRGVVLDCKLKEELSTTPLQAGDRILLFSNCIMRILERKKLSTAKENIRKKTFAEVGGLDSLRDDTLNLLGLTFDGSVYRTDEARLKKMGIGFPRGIAIHGPPGCGKDTFVAALANELGWPLFVINGPDITSMWVGVMEEVLRETFKVAVRNRPSLLFVNEAEALFPVRGSTPGQGYKVDYVAQFNVLMNSIEETTGVFVVLGTNRIDLIDPAVIRPGRFDRQVFVPRPNEDAARSILGIYLGRHPVDESSGSQDEMRKAWIENIVRSIYNTKDKKTFLFRAFWQNGGDQRFYFKDFVSGALLENIVDQLARRALKRLQLQDCQPDDPNFGIAPCDLENLVSETVVTTVPKARRALIQWLMVNGYPEASDFRGGIFEHHDAEDVEK